MRTDREIYLLADKDYSQLSSAESRKYKYIMSLPFGERMDLISINNPANKYGNEIRGFTLMEKATGGKIHRGRSATRSAEKRNG